MLFEGIVDDTQQTSNNHNSSPKGSIWLVTPTFLGASCLYFGRFVLDSNGVGLLVKVKVKIKVKLRGI